MPAAYDVIRDVIYMFHMPLFVFVSGFLYAATGGDRGDYGGFLLRKVRRLMIPYLTVSVIIILIKLSMSGVMPVDHPVTPRSFIETLWLPVAGYFLWFVWALWWMFLIVPWFGGGVRRPLLLIGSIMLLAVSDFLPELFCIRQFGAYLLYFVLGLMTYDHMRDRRIGRFSGGWQMGSVVLFLLLAVVLLSGCVPSGAVGIVRVFAAFAGTAASLSAAGRLRSSVSSGWVRRIMKLAAASYTIYLLHTVFEGFGKGILSRVGFFDLPPSQLIPWIGAAIVVTCGVAVPLWLHRRVFVK